MAARRCSLCGLNYPTSVHRCHVCDGQTDWMNNAEPDEDWQNEVDTRQAAMVLTEGDRITIWRFDVALSLGYTSDVAESLASSDADLHVLERLIRQGCALDVAARIV